jgi:Zn-dependent alcohol dehydrogenase
MIGVGVGLSDKKASDLYDVTMLQCVKVPEDTDLRLFAPLGCGLQTG